MAVIRQIKRIKTKSNGFSMVEVLIALFILVVVGIAFLISLHFALKANMLDDAQTTAESLARSQLEFIKQQHYIDYSLPLDPLDPSDPDPREPDKYVSIAPLAGYEITFTVTPFYKPDPLIEDYVDYGEGPFFVFNGDDGIQRITVTVKHVVVFSDGTSWDVDVTVVDYKMSR